MKKYYGIEWLKAVACIGILAMHVAANSDCEITGVVYQRVIPSFTDFVLLFMTISAFGMCCGYFEKVMSGEIKWSDFYGKRYGKILPFFGMLILLDVGMNPSDSALFEGFVEMTLLHGFIPRSLSVIGVGWFLGTVFIFYLVFPFFCVLIEKKYRAWLAFAGSLIVNYICSTYFHLERTNFLYSLCYFLAGGLIYIYRDKISKVKPYVWGIIAVPVILGYYVTNQNRITGLLVICVLVMLAISVECRKIGIITLLSSISMEIYLSHMVVFRGIERLHLNTLWGNGWLQYFATLTMVFLGSVAFSFCMQKLIEKGKGALKQIKR